MSQISIRKIVRDKSYLINSAFLLLKRNIIKWNTLKARPKFGPVHYLNASANWEGLAILNTIEWNIFRISLLYFVLLSFLHNDWNSKISGEIADKLNFKFWLETPDIFCGSNKRKRGKETLLNAGFVSYPSADFN